MSGWKKIPEGATVRLTGGIMEEVLFPTDGGPDFVRSGEITIDGQTFKTKIGLREWVSGYGDCHHDYEPYLYRERY